MYLYLHHTNCVKGQAKTHYIGYLGNENNYDVNELNRLKNYMKENERFKRKYTPKYLNSLIKRWRNERS